MESEIICKCKALIDFDNIIDLEFYFNELNYNKVFEKIAYEYIFQKIFLYACIKGKKPTIEWLCNKYTDFDDIQRIAIRQMFFYAKYLLIKNKHKDMIEWYDIFLNTLRIRDKKFKN